MNTAGHLRRLNTSRSVGGILLNGYLLLACSVALLLPSIVGTSLFYHHHLPRRSETLPLYLQYGAHQDPFAVTSLTTTPLKIEQYYDIGVVLSAPLSPANLAHGNFMILLELLDHGYPTDIRHHSTPGQIYNIDRPWVLFGTRRPALFPYQDPITSLARRIVSLPYDLLLLRPQHCNLHVPMAEAIIFSKPSLLPSAVYLEIQATHRIQIHSIHVTITARLGGLRWLMHHYRAITFVCLTTLFWGCELVFAGLAYLAWIWSTAKVSTAKEGVAFKTAELSDSLRTFPTFRNQPPLAFIGQTEQPTSTHGYKTGESPDGDDCEGLQAWKGDSGLGTSYSEGGDQPLWKRYSK